MNDATDNLSGTHAAKLARLKYLTPPACQGQIVEVSYAGVSDDCGDGWLVRRVWDRSDNTVSYSARAWEDGEPFEPWQSEPGGEFLPVEDGDRLLRHC